MARSDIHELVDCLKGGGTNLELLEKVGLTRRSRYRQFCVAGDVGEFIRARNDESLNGSKVGGLLVSGASLNLP